MKNRIITISREFGSGGRTIGKLVAEKLDIPCYDSQLIHQIALESGFDENYIKDAGEYAPGGFLSSALSSRSFGPTNEDLLWEVQQKIITELAEKGSCVIVGRCADYILQDRTDVLNVFIHGNEEEKCQRIMKLYEKSRKEALAMMKDTDKKRSINYAYHTEQKWGDTRNYALCMNSSILGYETCMELIKKSME